MRKLTIVLSAVLITLISTRVAAKETSTAKKSGSKSCIIQTGYGEAFGHGDTASKALENARLDCGEKIIDQYLALRGHIPEDMKAELATACVNLTCR